MTRLPNRALMLRRLNEALLLSRRAGTVVGVLVLDIDDFQRVNNSLGHEAGNQLIRQAGVRVRDCIRETDALAQQVQAAGPMDSPSTVARLAGDEFTIILNQLDAAEAAGRVANRLREVFEQPFRLEQQEVVISLSIGVSVYPDDGIEAETLLKHADIALSHAKKAGRDCARFYQASMNASVTSRLSMETQLRRAVEEQSLALHLQPKVRAGDGRCVGMEALIRWDHPELGRVPPPAFIPIAEETGLIMPLASGSSKRPAG